jgi:hypothetical protein
LPLHAGEGNNSVPKHLTQADVDQYSRRALSGEELLRVTDHIAECEPCRESLLAKLDIARAQAAIRRDLDSSAEHVSEKTIEAYIDRTLDADERKRVTAHLAECGSCAQDIQDLEIFAGQRPKAHPRFWYAAIAAALFILIASALLVLRRPTTQIASLHDEPGLDALSAQEREIARQALAKGELPLPAFLGEIAPEGGTLMGESDPGRFHLISPVATAVRSQQPTLRWSSAPEAVTYIVTLQELGATETISSAPISLTEWTTVGPLKAGLTYSWQVVAKTSTGEILAPQPPLPPARFRVLDAATETRIASLPASHLARGVFYARAGLFPEAEEELRILSHMNPGTKNISTLLRRAQQATRR